MNVWTQHIIDLTTEAAEILANIKAAARNGEITWQQRTELVSLVLQDVADQANLQKVRDLLYAWQ